MQSTAWVDHLINSLKGQQLRQTGDGSSQGQPLLPKNMMQTSVFGPHSKSELAQLSRKSLSSEKDEGYAAKDTIQHVNQTSQSNDSSPKSPEKELLATSNTQHSQFLQLLRQVAASKPAVNSSASTIREKVPTKEEQGVKSISGQNHNQNQNYRETSPRFFISQSESPSRQSQKHAQRQEPKRNEDGPSQSSPPILNQNMTAMPQNIQTMLPDLVDKRLLSEWLKFQNGQVSMPNPSSQNEERRLLQEQQMQILQKREELARQGSDQSYQNKLNCGNLTMQTDFRLAASTQNPSKDMNQTSQKSMHTIPQQQQQQQQQQIQQARNNWEAYASMLGMQQPADLQALQDFMNHAQNLQQQQQQQQQQIQVIPMQSQQGLLPVVQGNFISSWPMGQQQISAWQSWISSQQLNAPPAIVSAPQQLAMNGADAQIYLQQLQLQQQMFQQQSSQHQQPFSTSEIFLPSGLAMVGPGQAGLDFSMRSNSSTSSVDGSSLPSERHAAPLPPRWLNVEVLTAFSVNYEKSTPENIVFTTDIIEKGFLFHFMKRTKYHGLTPKQYRASVRKLVSDCRPGYSNEDRESLPKSLLKILQDHVEFVGRSHWGFKRFVVVGPDCAKFRAEQEKIERNAANFSLVVRSMLDCSRGLALPPLRRVDPLRTSLNKSREEAVSKRAATPEPRLESNSSSPIPVKDEISAKKISSSPVVVPVGLTNILKRKSLDISAEAKESKKKLSSEAMNGENLDGVKKLKSDSF